ARAAPDASLADGRCRDRENGGRPVRDAARRRERLPGGDHGADGAPRGAAPRDPHPPAGAARAQARPADRAARGGGEGGSARAQTGGSVADWGDTAIGYLGTGT